MFDKLRAILPNATFFPAASPEMIARAEDRLEFRMPDWLRNLYSQCNGIVSTSDIYLFPLEKVESCSENLVSWNQFLRDEWRYNFPDLKENRPEIDWTVCDPNPLLIIGTVHEALLNWAITSGDAKTILGYDVRSEGDPPEIIALDLLDACANHSKWVHDIEEQLFRGREFYRPVPKNQTPRDIDLLHDELTVRSAPGTVPGQYWNIQHGTSQRSGENGELFIIRIASEELRIVSRDGDLPFEMRLKVWSIAEDLSCVVWTVKAAADRILAAKDAVWLPWTDGNRPRPDEALLRQIWQDGGEKDAELAELANVLCDRDNRRLTEENPFGK